LIAAWFLSPEVELKRDGGAAPKGGGSWRLEELLRKAAERGVKVYVMVYGEVPFTLPNGSGHAAKRIREFVPNATVIRCPRRHWGNRGGILFWAHHEKIVCIDGGRGGAFVGGMDLSFGRWDFSSHPVGDVQVDGLSWWPGKDYSNEETHVTAPVTDPHTDHMDRRSEPRLPWHDFACQVRVHASLSPLPVARGE
jgi:phospholipase D1/2